MYVEVQQHVCKGTDMADRLAGSQLWRPPTSTQACGPGASSHRRGSHDRRGLAEESSVGVLSGVSGGAGTSAPPCPAVGGSEAGAPHVERTDHVSRAGGRPRADSPSRGRARSARRDPASLPVLRAGRPSRRRARKNLRSFAKLLFPACCSTYRPFGVEGQSCWVAVPAPQTGRDYLPTDTRRRAQAALPHPGAQSTPTHLHATQVSEIQGEAPAWHRTAPVRQQQGKEMRV